MFEKLISQLGAALSKKKIPYMIIGGQAVLLYGFPRLTKDIDITLGISVERLGDIVEVCRDERFIVLPEDYKDFVQETFVLPVKDRSTGIRIDFIFSFTPYERQAINRSKTVKMGGTEVRFAAVEDVVIHKIFSGRPRDIEDVTQLFIKNPGLDTDYINKWLQEFDNMAPGSDFTGSFKAICKED